MTELVFILDRSGSMAGLEADTIGGFNAMIEKQKREPGPALVSTVLFSNESKVIHDRLPLDRVPPMTERSISPAAARRCSTPSAGPSITSETSTNTPAARTIGAERTLFVITTDGLENASRRYDYAAVRRMIERQKERYGWEFLFLGANIDAAREAARFGIRPDRAVNYRCDRGRHGAEL